MVYPLIRIKNFYNLFQFNNSNNFQTFFCAFLSTSYPPNREKIILFLSSNSEIIFHSTISLETIELHIHSNKIIDTMDLFNYLGKKLLQNLERNKNNYKNMDLSEKILHRFEIEKTIYSSYDISDEKWKGCGIICPDMGNFYFSIIMLLSWYAYNDIRFINAGLKNDGIPTELINVFTKEVELL